MAISSIGWRRKRDKAPLSVGWNLEKIEFMARETGKMIHDCLKSCILGRDFRFTLAATCL